MVNTTCMALASILGDLVFYPGAETYKASLASYFSPFESALQPACIVYPKSAQDVSKAIKTLTSESYQGTKFAVRSGGHMVWPGSANIADGVTIDLRGLNSIKVSDDRSSVSVGPGARWVDVYGELDAVGLAVLGGRSSTVGVGGLITGGGLSYFSPRYGWACDTVSNFEVVLGNGSVVNANAKENPVLLAGLRGGSNNLGVVTRVDLKAFEQGLLWGGVVYNAIDTADAQLEAFAEINSADSYDEYASLITSFGYSTAGGGAAFANEIEYTKPVENPPVFQKLMSLPALQSTMRMANMTSLSEETAALEPPGLRTIFASITTTSSVEVLNTTFRNWNASIEGIKDIPGIIWTISLEPLPPAIYKKGASANSMGLGDRTESLVVTLLTVTHTEAADDDRVEKAARALLDAIAADAQKLNGLDPFIYLNYAGGWQDPIAGYGQSSINRLKQASRDYDPRGIFRRHVPGGFKLH